MGMLIHDNASRCSQYALSLFLDIVGALSSSSILIATRGHGVVAEKSR